jgi:hypothetical protein
LQQEPQHLVHCCWVRVRQGSCLRQVLLLLGGQQVPQALILAAEGMVVLYKGPQHQLLPRQLLPLLGHLSLQLLDVPLHHLPVPRSCLLQLCDPLQQVCI